MIILFFYFFFAPGHERQKISRGSNLICCKDRALFPPIKVAAAKRSKGKCQHRSPQSQMLLWLIPDCTSVHITAPAQMRALHPIYAWGYPIDLWSLLIQSSNSARSAPFEDSQGSDRSKGVKFLKFRRSSRTTWHCFPFDYRGVHHLSFCFTCLSSYSNPPRWRSIERAARLEWRTRLNGTPGWARLVSPPVPFIVITRQYDAFFLPFPHCCLSFSRGGGGFLLLWLNEPPWCLKSVPVALPNQWKAFKVFRHNCRD